MAKPIFILIALLTLVGCSQASPNQAPWQTVDGRDTGDTIVRHPVYRARVPNNWKRIDPSPQHSIADTKLPLCEFQIDDPQGSVRITVHNFPADTAEERIPPAAQIARWKRQLNLTSPVESLTTPIAQGGFSGLQLEASGILAWAMQLGITHFRNLQLHGPPQEQHFLRQMRADYTIKATGPQTSLQAHRASLIAFAHSFELIQEIPSPL